MPNRGCARAPRGASVLAASEPAAMTNRRREGEGLRGWGVGGEEFGKVTEL